MKNLAKLVILSSLALSVTACELVIPSPNQPDYQGTIDNPTISTIEALAQGALVRSRATAIGAQNGYVSQLGVVGRESYISDNADPRAIDQLLGASADGDTTLNPGDGAFGGNHWTGGYLAVQFNEIILDVAQGPAAAGLLSPEQIQALIGWARFHQAYALTPVVTTHVCPPAISGSDLCQDAAGTNRVYGAVLAFDDIDAFDPDAITPEALNEVAPIVNDPAEAYGRIIELYGQAITAFEAAGDTAFPFTMPPGFGQFNTPALLAQVAAGLQARVALYIDDVDGALTFLDSSFIDEDSTAFAAGPQDDVGIFFDYSTDSNDATNALGTDNNLLAHPSLGPAFATPGDNGEPNYTGTHFVQFQAGGDPDARYSLKVVPNLVGGVQTNVALGGIESNTRFGNNTGVGLYPNLETQAPIIRNEELLLIKAEALARSTTQQDLPAATTLVNAVRVSGGALEPVADFADGDAAVAAIVLERQYSLMFEGGHRWMDIRRLDLVDEVPLDRDNDLVNLAWPINLSEINARTPAAE